MMGRLLWGGLWIALAAVLAWWGTEKSPQREWLTLAAGGLAGMFCWLFDVVQAARFARWLQKDDVHAPGMGRGFWGDQTDKVRRAMRKRECKVQEHETRLHDFLQALQATPNGVMLLLSDGRIEWFNAAAAQHFGLDPARDLQQHISNLVRDPVFVNYLASPQGEEGITLQGRQSTPTRPVRLAVQRYPYGQGRYLMLSRDITAMEQADTMRRDFVANVSHEIRTPLTVLAGFVETLQSLPLEQEERERYLDLMAQQAQRMQTLVSDLLTLSRLEGSPPPSGSEWVPVAPLVAQCAQEARDLSLLIWGKEHRLQASVPQGLQIAGSANELHSALSNLVGNAVRYSAPEQPIVMEYTTRADGSGVLSVRDQGPGIAAEHLPRLTERFYRVDRSRSRETGGTGLGLAIVKHVLQRHSGHLEIESTPGKGSRFSMVFAAPRLRIDAR